MFLNFNIHPYKSSYYFFFHINISLVSNTHCLNICISIHIFLLYPAWLSKARNVGPFMLISRQPGPTALAAQPDKFLIKIFQGIDSNIWDAKMILLLFIQALCFYFNPKIPKWGTFFFLDKWTLNLWYQFVIICTYNYNFIRSVHDKYKWSPNYNQLTF